MDEIWNLAFELAWEAFVEGSIPVGAVVVDGRGAVVSTGRNRMVSTAGTPGQLAGSRIAHAEINALAGLPHDADVADHVVYSTLEPCFMCALALRFAHVGEVRYAAADDWWYGSDRLPEINHHVARRWPRRTALPDGPLPRFSALLVRLSAVERGVDTETGAGTGSGSVDPVRLRTLTWREAMAQVL